MMFASSARVPNLDSIAECLSKPTIRVAFPWTGKTEAPKTGAGKTSPKTEIGNQLFQLGQYGKKAVHHASRFLTLMLLIIGLCTVFDEVVGDGDLPRLSVLPQMNAQARINSTAALAESESPEKYWQALAPTRELLTALSPEISAWLYDMHRQNRLAYDEPADSQATYGMPEDTMLIAAYRHINGKLYIGKAFWHLSDGEKASVLIHEYRHFRQNPPKRISHQLAQLLGGGRLRYQSAIEDEAFAYERQAQAALGL